MVSRKGLHNYTHNVIQVMTFAPVSLRTLVCSCPFVASPAVFLLRHPSTLKSFQNLPYNSLPSTLVANPYCTQFSQPVESLLEIFNPTCRSKTELSTKLGKLIRRFVLFHSHPSHFFKILNVPSRLLLVSGLRFENVADYIIP